MTDLAWTRCAALAAATLGAIGCGAPLPANRHTAATGSDAAAGGDDGGTAPGADAAARDPMACSDLFDQSTLQQYWIDITPTELAKLNAEFIDLAGVLAGTAQKSYHPIVFHLGSETGETVTDAQIRLKGQSSWVLTVQNDPLPKMQVEISFDQTNLNGKFHGVSKLSFDMPRSDWTFLHERIANTWWRQRGVMAPRSSSGRLYINGSYYGLYVVEDHVGHSLVKTFFPGNPDGNLFKGGAEPDQNNTTPNAARLQQFWAASNVTAMQSIIDIPTSVLEWAGDALLNNGDGYYGGAHNFFIYDQGAKGYVWLPTDDDATIDWLAFNGPFTFDDHPVYWWEGRAGFDPPGQHWLAVMNDATWRQRYVDAIATQVQHWDVQQMQSWVDTWSQQIAQAVSEDQRKQATMAQWQAATAMAREIVQKRPAYLQSFVDCERGQSGAGTDADGDGYKWCEDCRDDAASIHPGAPEICGNGIDDNCNGLVDEGCPGSPAGTVVGTAPATAPAPAPAPRDAGVD